MESKEILDIVNSALNDKKAMDIVNIDITDKQIEQCKEYIKYFNLGKFDLYSDFSLLEMLMKNRKKMYDENKKLQKNNQKTAEM